MLRTIMLVLALPLASAPSAEAPAGILSCQLDQEESFDAKTGERKLEPIWGWTNDGGKAPAPHTLVIAGLGTKHVTAKARIYSLVLGEEVFPMDAGGRYVADNMEYADWFYVRTEHGVTVLEIPRKGRPNVTVRLHNLGQVPYTYIGQCE